MRIGLDVDGVLANFFPAYEKFAIVVQGEDLFGEHKWPNETPCTWNWPEHYGYTKETMKVVWRLIKSSNCFWKDLEPLFDPDYWPHKLEDHQLYFITDRPGTTAKQQTEQWLRMQYGIDNPTVIISRTGKGSVAAALDLELYVDDKAENILDVQEKAPTTRAYLLNRPYNASYTVNRRSDNLLDIFKKEGLL